MKIISFLLLISYIALGCNNPNVFNSALEKAERDSLDMKLDSLILPEGLKIEYYAKNVPNARSIKLSPSGILYVGTRSNGSVYALVDSDKDAVSDSTHVLFEGLNSPNGIALKDGDLYIAEIDRILKVTNIDEKVLNGNEINYQEVYTDYPSDKHHGWKFIAFGPDGHLYVPVGAPCNICESKDSVYASITQLNLDSKTKKVVAHGVRNTVGFDWDPETGDLWFTDNGRDWMGDNKPPCELNHLKKEGQHFGYPYCHGGKYADPEYGSEGICDEYSDPALNLGPHVAPLGMEFVEKNHNLDSQFTNDILIAEHGSWNRTEPIGYRITRADRSNPEELTYHNFITGWLGEEKAWGRPVDLEWMQDGSLLISDDFNDAVYRVFQEVEVEEADKK